MTATTTPLEAASGSTARRVAWIGGTLVLGAIVSAPVAASAPPLVVLAAVVAIALLTVAYVHPPAAAYVLLAGTPLMAGHPRDAIVPGMRLHEALGVLLFTGVALRTLAQWRTGHRPRLGWGPVDRAIILMAVTSSVLPLLWMVSRGRNPTLEDLLYATVLWKLYGIYLLVRISCRTDRQVSGCLWICIATGGLLAVVATTQSLVPAVGHVVNTVYPVEFGSGPAPGRGSAMLGSSIAVGDVMAFDLAICLGWASRPTPHRRLLLALALVFCFGALGSGQFSGVIALVVAVLVVAVLTRQVMRLLIYSVPTSLVAAILLSPVIKLRLENLDPVTGLPQSWYVRLENLRRYVWPEVFRWPDWLLGVRPTAVLRVHAPWGDELYIESGHTWLLWTGGVPLVVAYLYFSWVALRATASVALERADAVGVAATASAASLVVSFVVMTLDPHLTMRGTGDLLFSLLALAAVSPQPAREHPAAVALRDVGSPDPR